jgi:hypothetical protein
MSSTITALTSGGGLAMAGDTSGQLEFKSDSTKLGLVGTGTSTAFGYQALNSNTGGTNTALGYQALFTNSTGDTNTAIGYRALYSNTTGTNNHAFGRGALNANTTGANNAAVGDQAGWSGTTGAGNTYIGTQAGYSATDPSGVTAIGYQAAYSNTRSNNMTAIGNGAAYTSNRTGGGAGGVYVGANAGFALTQGYNNCFVGQNAGSNCTTGAENICIGTNSGTDAVFNLGVGDNRIVMGYNGSTNAYIKVAWTVTSDARDKTSISPLGLGLNFVSQLNPVSYNFKKSREDDTPHGNKRYGFLAQDILALEGNEAIIIDNEDEDNLKYNGEALVPVLVKALQELNAKVDAQALEIQALKGVA